MDHVSTQSREQQQAPIQQQTPIQQAPIQQHHMDTYEHQTNDLMNAKRSKHQVSQKMAMVRENIQRELPQAYDNLQKIASGEQSNVVTLHHSRGTQLLEDGQNVLEFDIAGSGYRAFMRANKALAGRNGLKTKLADGTKIKVSWEDMRKLGALTVEEFEAKMQAMPEKTEKQRQTKQLIRENIDAFRGERDLFYDTYGRPVEIEGLKDKKYILSKRTEHNNIDGTTSYKQRVTMAGPLNFKGLLNRGDYSIEQLRSYMLTMSQSYLTPIFNQWEDLLNEAEKKDKNGEPDAAEQLRAQIHEVSILLKGNSRGAVALAQGAMMTKYWVHENFPHLEQWVKFETIQYDPVPGLGSRSDENDVLSLTNGAGVSDEELEQLREKKMMPLGDQDETTLFYSMHQQHDNGFTPQLIKGAKRVILTPYNHSIMQDKVDQSQDGVKKRFAFTDAKTGEVYRSSGLNRLDPGLYFADEKGVLVQITDEKMAKRLVREIVKDTSSSQKDRHKRMEEVISAWFGSRYAHTNTQKAQPQPNIQQAELTTELADQLYAQFQEQYESLNGYDTEALEATLRDLERRIIEIQEQVHDADAQRIEEINEYIANISETYCDLQDELKRQPKVRKSKKEKQDEIRHVQERLHGVVRLAQELRETRADEILNADKDTQYRFLMNAYQISEYLESLSSLGKKDQLEHITQLDTLTAQLQSVQTQLTPVLQALTRQLYDEHEPQTPVFVDTELFAERMDVHEDMTAEDMRKFYATAVEYNRYREQCTVETDQSRFYEYMWERATDRIERSEKLRTLYAKTVTIFYTQARLSYLDASQSYIDLVKEKFPDVDETMRQDFAYFLMEQTAEGQRLRNIELYFANEVGSTAIAEGQEKGLGEEALKETYGENWSDFRKKAELGEGASLRGNAFGERLVGKSNIAASIEDEIGSFVDSHMQRENASDQYMKQIHDVDQASVNLRRELGTFTDALMRQKQFDARQILGSVSQFRQICENRTGELQTRIDAVQPFHDRLMTMLAGYTALEKHDANIEHRLRYMISALEKYQKSLGQLRIKTSQMRKAVEENPHIQAVTLQMAQKRSGLLKQFFTYERERAWNDSDEFIAVGTNLDAYLNSTSPYYTLLDRDSAKTQYNRLQRALKTYLRTRKNASSDKGKRRLALVQQLLDGVQQHEQTRERYYIYAHAVQNKS